MTRHVRFRATPIDGFDLDFRPASYWALDDATATILQNIKGARRREMVRDFLEGSASDLLGPIETDLLADELDRGTRSVLGSIHPGWMGGEYLPGYLRGEVEIARIELKSTLEDVYSIRARRSAPGRAIRYRFLDEHDMRFVTCRKTSQRPLTLGELGELIDNVHEKEGEPGEEPFVESCALFGADGDIDFVSLDSVVYPSLGSYYDARLVAWARARELEQEEEEFDEES